MIPSPRLLAVAAGFFPLAIAAGVWPDAAPLVLALAGALILIAALDAWTSRQLLAGLRASAPETRLHKDRAATWPIDVEGPRTLPALRVGIAWPTGIEATTGEQTIALDASTAATVPWEILPRRRGDYRIALLYTATPSRLGLWEVRGHCALDAVIRVYPNLRERGELLALRGQQTGELARRQIGRGREFDHLREYAPGDGVDEIDWKATARRGKPIARVYQVERTQDVYAIVDASRLTGRLHGAEPRLERYVQASLALGAIVRKQGDRFGVASFTDRVHEFVRSGRGGSQAALCREALYKLHPATIPPAFDEVSPSLAVRLRGRALLVFFTDLDDPAAATAFTSAAALLSRKHLVAAISIRPAGAEPLFSQPATADDSLHDRLGGHMQWSQLEQVSARLRSRGVTFRLAAGDTLTREAASLYGEIKRRQML